MPEEYGKAVLTAYQKKKEDESLSSNLLNPTPGSLREECLIVYRERQLTSKDEEILRQFFGAAEQGKGYFGLINSSFASKFKQMPKIIRRDVPNPGIKFIELLAWLIDFQPRTSISYYNSFDKQDIIEKPDVKIDKTQNETTGDNDGGEQKLENEGNNIIEESGNKDEVEKGKKEPMEGPNTIEPFGETENRGEKEPVVKPTTPPVIIIPVKINDGDKGADETINVDPPGEPVYEPRFPTRQIIITCITLLLIGSASFVVWENSATTIRLPKADEKSMYWDGDHYEPIKDGEQRAGATVIPLNIQTLKQQRKINLPDTLTSYSLGKVWYRGYGANHEYFTTAGLYPSDTSRVLKKLSTGILKNHISYYRYLLTHLIWLLCATFFISLCGYSASKMKRKVTVDNQEQKTDEHIADYSEAQLAQQ
ncbi:hypothetical protein [Pedobacter sp. ISL-64]|uniref:hypothetical protein n=1 Tax=Pedobacter sp. ISL-64 TaxID=2819164 RepID=UPI001BE6F5EA|nr:hypothetical protein [Pedobacter sp. ISL-64]MBT2562549.1 hypothetical protein [Pedobacter sp. ISL-64]